MSGVDEERAALVARMSSRWSQLGIAEKAAALKQLRGLVRSEIDLDAYEIFKMKLEIEADNVSLAYRKQCPIGFFKPSYDQAQILNCWHPDWKFKGKAGGYEGPIQSFANLSLNRGGKSCSSIINTLLWIIPNNPEWLLFQEHEDEFGRGKYRVFPRPEWLFWRKKGKMIYPGLNAPPRSGDGCMIWHGVPSEGKWRDPIEPEYRKWIPPDEIGKNKDGDIWYKSTMSFETRWGHTVQGKLYTADVISWSGTACWMLNFDEGMERNILSEAMPRVQAGGYVTWSYTPAEPRNIANRAQLAKDVYDGKYPLIGKTAFFFFSIDTTPDYIIAKEKKAADKKRCAMLGTEGQVRMHGGFSLSSPMVFSHFDRDFHVLEMDDKEALAKWPNANLFRGIDEGTAHPGTCVWAMLLPSNEFVVYRVYSRVGASIGDRCKDIIELSGNQMSASGVSGTPDQPVIRWREQVMKEKYRGTFADPSIWMRKRDNIKDRWSDDYRRAGMPIKQATGIGPAARGDAVNDLLRKDHTRMHLEKGCKPGARLYFTVNCALLIEKIENYFQAQKKSGPEAGSFTGNPHNLGDDEIHAMQYALLNKMRWTPVEDEDGDEDNFQHTVTRTNKVTGYESFR